MELTIKEIKKEQENPLFKRKEVKVLVEGDVNPKISEAAHIVSEKYKVSIENIKIRNVKGKFGRNTFLIEANLYESKEEKERNEVKSKKELDAEKAEAEAAKKAEEEAKAAEEAKKAEEEKPAEENKPEEESKEEENKSEEKTE